MTTRTRAKQTPHEFGIRPGAGQAWKALADALDGIRPPCQQQPELWTSKSAADREAATHKCRPCPALAECARFATANHEPCGVWGARDRGRP